MPSFISPPIKNGTTKSVKFTYNMEEFEKNVNKFIDDAKVKSRQILVKITPDFVQAAMKYTPPDMGHSVIKKERYMRPILNLIKLVRGEYDGYLPTQEDAHELRYNKMKYKVLYTKQGIKKGTAFAYTKKIGQAKKAAKIANRGISRVMWGKDLGAIGAKTPVSLERLIMKSPNINKHNFNEISINQIGDETSVEITNKVAQIERYAKIAEKRGYKKAISSLMRELKKIADEQKTL